MYLSEALIPWNKRALSVFWFAKFICLFLIETWESWQLQLTQKSVFNTLKQWLSWQGFLFLLFFNQRINSRKLRCKSKYIHCTYDCMQQRKKNPTHLLDLALAKCHLGNLNEKMKVSLFLGPLNFWAAWLWHEIWSFIHAWMRSSSTQRI